MKLTPEQLARRIADLTLLQKQQRAAMTRIVLTVHGNAQQEAPVKSGHLRRTITHRVTSNGARGVVGTNASYAKAVHDGSKPHVILPRNGRALSFVVGGVRVFTKRVRHPGTKPNRFFDRALEKSRDRIDIELASVGKDYLESLVR